MAELSGIGTATVDVHDSHRTKARKDRQILEQDMTMGTDNMREDEQQNIILVKHGERTASRDASKSAVGPAFMARRAGALLPTLRPKPGSLPDHHSLPVTNVHTSALLVSIGRSYTDSPFGKRMRLVTKSAVLVFK